MKSQCKSCMRYHPKGKGNCKKANAWMYVASVHKYKIIIQDCPEFLASDDAFPLTESEKKKEKASKKKEEKTGNKKVDMEMSPEEYARDWNR